MQWNREYSHFTQIGEKNGHKNAQENLCKKLQTKNLKKKKKHWERDFLGKRDCSKLFTKKDDVQSMWKFSWSNLTLAPIRSKSWAPFASAQCPVSNLLRKQAATKQRAIALLRESLWEKSKNKATSAPLAVTAAQFLTVCLANRQTQATLLRVLSA